MEKPIIAINIIAYNNKDCIGKCLEGILSQKTTYPYEIRIYDDCSTDGSQEYLQEYIKKYPDKIKLYFHKENTFCKPYEQTQSYELIQNIDTKYFAIMEADDYWCDENKLQMGLDFLESHPEYSGWAHDTLHNYKYKGAHYSWIHECFPFNVVNPVTINSPYTFFFTSSRIFRNYDYKSKKLWAMDYLVYFYHLSKGPIHFHDKIMSVYNQGDGLWANTNNEQLCSSFAYKISMLLDFKYDDVCMKIQKWYDDAVHVGKFRYNFLVFLKKIFGIKLGWKIWYFITFVPIYGLECLNINWGFPRKRAKKNYDSNILARTKHDDNILNAEINNLKNLQNAYFKEKSVHNKHQFFMMMRIFLNKYLANKQVDALKKLLSNFCDETVVDNFMFHILKPTTVVQNPDNKFKIIFAISFVINVILIILLILLKGNFNV